MKKLLTSLAILAALSFQAAALTLTTTSTDYLGSIKPGLPSGEADEVSYVTQLTGMAASSSITIDGNEFSRSANGFASLPPVVFDGKDEDVTGQTTVTIPSNIEYILLKYGKSADVQQSLVWVVGGATGTFDLPTAGGLSHITLFKGNDVPPTPDSGSALIMLGLALGAAGLVSRKR